MTNFGLTSSTSLDSQIRLQIAQYCSKEEEDHCRTAAEQHTALQVSEFVTRDQPSKLSFKRKT